MKKSSMIVAVSILLSATTALAKSPPSHRIIVQLSSSDTAVWKATMHNIKNLKEGWGNDVEIEVVAHGPGISFLLAGRNAPYEMLRTLRREGVKFVACENTMRAKHIEKSELVPEAGTVPMGVGEVVMKQEKGWSYLKAGF